MKVMEEGISKGSVLCTPGTVIRCLPQYLHGHEHRTGLPPCHHILATKGVVQTECLAEMYLEISLSTFIERVLFSSSTRFILELLWLLGTYNNQDIGIPGENKRTCPIWWPQYHLIYVCVREWNMGCIGLRFSLCEAPKLPIGCHTVIWGPIILFIYTFWMASY